MPPIPAETTDPATIAWARHLLGLTAEDLNDSDRGPMLRRLVAVEFRTPPMVVEAALTLSGKKPRSMARRADFEELLRERINRFAEQFFKLSPEKRAQEYRALAPVDAASAAAYPAHAERLRRLEPLLDLSPARGMKLLDAPARELARHLMRLATLAPAEQAVQRRRLVSKMLDDAPRWQTAAETIARQAPELIRLDRSLFKQLKQLGDRESLVRKATKEIAGPLRAASRANQAVPASGGSSEQAGSRSAGWVAFVIVLSVIATIARISTRISNRDADRQAETVPVTSLNLDQNQPVLNPENRRALEELFRENARRRQINAGAIQDGTTRTLNESETPASGSPQAAPVVGNDPSQQVQNARERFERQLEQIRQSRPAPPGFDPRTERPTFQPPSFPNRPPGTQFPPQPRFPAPPPLPSPP